MKVANSSLQDWAEVIRKRLPKRVSILIRMASYDLQHGPTSQNYGGVRYPGFVSATQEIGQALSNMGINWYDLYLDMQAGEVLNEEPQPWYDEEAEGWIDPSWEDFCKIDHKEALAAVLSNAELAKNIDV